MVLESSCTARIPSLRSVEFVIPFRHGQFIEHLACTQQKRKSRLAKQISWRRHRRWPYSASPQLNTANACSKWAMARLGRRWRLLSQAKRRRRRRRQPQSATSSLNNVAVCRILFSGLAPNLGSSCHETPHSDRIEREMRSAEQGSPGPRRRGDHTGRQWRLLYRINAVAVGSRNLLRDLVPNLHSSCHKTIHFDRIERDMRSVDPGSPRLRRRGDHPRRRWRLSVDDAVCTRRYQT